MFELAVLAVAVAAVGVLRPRWSSLLVALVPFALACAWLVLGPDHGGPLGVVDLAWLAGMAALVGVAFAVVAAMGVLAGRRLR